MRKYVKTVIFALLGLSVLLILAGCAMGAGIIDYKVKVMIAESDNLTVIGDNPLVVDAGTDVSVNVEIPDGMKVSEISGGAYYEDGCIKIDSVRFPVTVKTTVREYYKCSYRVNATKGGSTSEANKWIDATEDDEIMVQAKANSGYMFLGWSVGSKVADGGTVISTDRIYKFNITGEVDLFANFIDENASVIRYNANGGTALKTGTESYVDTVIDEYHFYANSLPDMEYFERDGYVLYGYNTQADGGGDYFGLGWNITLDEKIIDLYCMWAEETPASSFKYERDKKDIFITGYTGDDETIVIPKQIDGRTVVGIKSGAFKACGADTVIISAGMEDIEERAFSSCALQSLYMADTVLNVYDTSFRNCNNLANLYVNAATHPTYQRNDHGTYSIKYERLVYAYRNNLKKIAFTSGSNGTYGVLSEQLEDGLGGEYYIIDYSLHYQTCGMFFIDLISDFLREDDIMLFMPEPNEYQHGTNVWNSIMWQFFEAAYGCVTHVDIRDYRGVFDTFREFNYTRQWMSRTKYTDYWNGIDRYGDNSWFRWGESKNFIGSQGTYDLSTDCVNVDNLNYVFDKCHAAGAKVYYSFPSLNVNALVGKGKKESYREDYEQFMKDNLNVTVISDVEQYIFSGIYMSGTNFHLSTEGSQLRTDYLIKDIKAQLKIDYPNK